MNTALPAVKATEEHDDLHVDFARQCGKSPVTTSAVFHCVYLAWKHPCRRIELAFHISRPAFPPRTRPCERLKSPRSTMNCTLTSPDSFFSPQSRRPPQRKFQTSSPGWLVDPEAGKYFFLHYRGGFLSAYEEGNKAEPPLFTHT